MATTKLFRRRIDAMIYLRRPREPLRGGALLALALELHNPPPRPRGRAAASSAARSTELRLRSSRSPCVQRPCCAITIPINWTHGYCRRLDSELMHPMCAPAPSETESGLALGPTPCSLQRCDARGAPSARVPSSTSRAGDARWPTPRISSPAPLSARRSRRAAPRWCSRRRPRAARRSPRPPRRHGRRAASAASAPPSGRGRAGRPTHACRCR